MFAIFLLLPPKSIDNKLIFIHFLKRQHNTCDNDVRWNRGSSLRRVKNGSKWRAKEISIDGKPPAFSSSSAAAAAAAAATNRNSANLSSTELSPALLAQANWTFVEKLLKVGIADKSLSHKKSQL